MRHTVAHRSCGVFSVRIERTLTVFSVSKTGDARVEAREVRWMMAANGSFMFLGGDLGYAS
jgi:hypothetical protein